MPTWNYEARDAGGNMVRGAHEAANRPAALEFLRAQGLFLTRLEAARRGAAPASSRPSVAPSAPSSVAPSAPSSVAPRAPLEKPAPRDPAAPEAFAPRPITLPTGTAIGAPVGVPTPGASGVPGGARTGGAMPALGTAPRANPPLPTQPMLRANSKDLATYFRQIGAMTHAGTTLGTALHSMREHAPNAALRNASEQIETRVMSGETLSASMRSFPGLFSPLQIGMISAGERGGFLVEMFQRLAKYSERDYDLQQTVKRETWYPKLLIGASIFIPSAIPLVVTMVQGKGNPFLAWLGAVWAPLFLVGCAVFIYRAINFASPYASHQSALKLTLDRFKLVLPIGGKVVRGLATAKFCRALGTLYSAGVGPRESVKLAADACGNAAIAEAAIRVVPRLEEGETLTACLGSTGYFPSTVMQVMAVGEESGNLDEQLEKAADFLEADAEVAIKQAVQVGSMLLFLGIAIYIGISVGKFWMSYFGEAFDMGEQMAE